MQKINLLMGLSFLAMICNTLTIQYGQVTQQIQAQSRIITFQFNNLNDMQNFNTSFLHQFLNNRVLVNRFRFQTSYDLTNGELNTILNTPLAIQYYYNVQ